jgi:anti-sigma factor RsiW
MDDRELYDDEQIQAYIEGRLPEAEATAVVAYLRSRPRLAADVEQLRRQNLALKSVGQDILDEPIPDRLRQVLKSIGQDVLDEPVPEQLRQVLHNAHQAPQMAEAVAAPVERTPAIIMPAVPNHGRLFIEAALALLLLFAGAAVGWFLNDRLVPTNQGQPITAELASVYNFYGSAQDYPLDFPADRFQAFEALVNQAFEARIEPPDLSAFDYRFVGGRLEPVSGAQVVGLFEFQNPEQARLAVFFWRGQGPDAGAADSAQMASLGDQAELLSKVWLSGNLHFALFADRQNQAFDQIADSVAKFYEQAFATH